MGRVYLLLVSALYLVLAATAGCSADGGDERDVGLGGGADAAAADVWTGDGGAPGPDVGSASSDITRDTAPDVALDTAGTEPNIPPDVPHAGPDTDAAPDTGAASDIVTEPRCARDADCVLLVAPNACQRAWCDTAEGACRIEAREGCCMVDEDCDDGDPTTPNVCPEPGGACDVRLDGCVDALDSDGLCRDLLGAPYPDGTLAPCDIPRCNMATDRCIIEDTRGPYCCVSAADCDDGNAATQDVCSAVGGECLFGHPEPPCPWGIVAEWDFEDGTLQGLQVNDLNPADNVTWHIVDTRVYAGKAIYLGDPDTGCYFNGDEVDASCETPYEPLEDPQHGGPINVRLVSEEIYLDVGQAVPFMLGFWIQGESEPPLDGIPFVPDNLVVYVEDVSDLGNLTLLFETATYLNNIPSPQYVAADMSQFAGRAVRLHIAFDTFTADANRYAGWWLDEMKIRTFCASLFCQTDEDCGDANACTNDTCTLLENSLGGVCAHNYVDPDCVPCLEDSECEDDDACTIDRCQNSVCTHTPGC